MVAVFSNHSAIWRLLHLVDLHSLFPRLQSKLGKYWTENVRFSVHLLKIYERRQFTLRKTSSTFSPYLLASHISSSAEHFFQCTVSIIYFRRKWIENACKTWTKKMDDYVFEVDILRMEIIDYGFLRKNSLPDTH